MRFILVLIALALLPIFVMVQTWTFHQNEQAGLSKLASDTLYHHGIQSGSVDVQFLDLFIQGEAPDIPSRNAATRAMETLPPFRLVENRLSVPAHFLGRLDGNSLIVSGAFPTQADADTALHTLSQARPDLKIDSKALLVSEFVRWRQGEGVTLNEDSVFLRPILEGLKVPPRLEIRKDGSLVKISGFLPAQALKDSIVEVVRQHVLPLKTDAEELRVSRATQPAPFTQSSALVDFLRNYYDGSTPELFSISGSGNPHLKARATRSMEGEWLHLLRAVSGAGKVEAEIELYPSRYHFPDYQRLTSIDPSLLKQVQEALASSIVNFPDGSVSLSPDAESRLALITPLLLNAGPPLRLIIGGHPHSDGDSARQAALARSRAEQVLSFLIEQGVPSADIQALAFEPVPAGSPFAPLAGAVEILVK